MSFIEKIATDASPETTTGTEEQHHPTPDPTSDDAPEAESQWDEETESEYCDQHCDEELCKKEEISKVCRFDQYTAIATSISTPINGMSMHDHIQAFRAKTIETQGEFGLEDFIIMTGLFSSYIEAQCRQHTQKNLGLPSGMILITRFDTDHGATHTCKIRIREYIRPDLDPWALLLINDKLGKLVAGGICPRTRNPLREMPDNFLDSLPCMLRNTIGRLRSPDPRLPVSFARFLGRDPHLNHLLLDDMHFMALPGLTRRRALNLAVLIMRALADYKELSGNTASERNSSERRPFAGGLARLAIVEEKGVSFLI